MAADREHEHKRKSHKDGKAPTTPQSPDADLVVVTPAEQARYLAMVRRAFRKAANFVRVDEPSLPAGGEYWLGQVCLTRNYVVSGVAAGACGVPGAWHWVLHTRPLEMSTQTYATKDEALDGLQERVQQSHLPPE
jgi:hypothetical protein